MSSILSSRLSWQSASGQHEVTQALAAIWQPIATVHRIAFLTTSPDIDTDTVCRLIARVLSRHRPGRILLTSEPGARSQRQPVDRPTPEQLLPLPETMRDELRLDGRVWNGPADIDDRFFDVHCSDWGVCGPTTGALEAGSRAHTVCVVAPVDRAGAEPAVALAEALAIHTAGAASVVAFVDDRRERGSWARQVGAQLSVPSVVFGYDSGLLSSDADHLSRRTERALTLLAGGLMPGAGSIR